MNNSYVVVSFNVEQVEAIAKITGLVVSDSASAKEALIQYLGLPATRKRGEQIRRKKTPKK